MEAYQGGYSESMLGTGKRMAELERRIQALEEQSRKAAWLESPFSLRREQERNIEIDVINI